MPDRQRGTSSLRPEATPVALETIDWEHAKLLSAAGAYGVIYRVAPGLVAKVGFILPEEARRIARRFAMRSHPCSSKSPSPSITIP